MNHDIEHVVINGKYIDTLTDAIYFLDSYLSEFNIEMSDSITLPPDMANAIRRFKSNSHEHVSNIEDKVYSNNGGFIFSEDEVLFIYEALQYYKKYLQSQLSFHKKGTAGYKRTKKALTEIPRIITTYIPRVEVRYVDEDND